MSSDGYINLGLSIPPTVLTIIGNTVFFITLLKTSSLHTPSNVLLGAMCITDLIAGLVCQPINMAFRLCEAGPFCPKLYSAYVFIFHLSPLNSFVFGLLITLDRYIAICYPYRYLEHATCRKYAYMAFGVFMLSAIYAVIEFRFLKYTKLPFWALEAALQVLTFIAVVIMYAKIYRVVLSQQHRIASLSVTRESRISLTERSRTHTVTIILAVFIACNFPFTVHYTLSMFRYILKIDRPLESGLWANYFALFNSCLNPIIYCARSKEIRKAAVRIFMPNSRFGRDTPNASENATEVRVDGESQCVATTAV